MTLRLPTSAPLALAASLLLAAAPSAADGLAPPFAVRTLDSRAAAKPCASAPAPVAALSLDSKYGQAGSGSAGSRRDSVDDAAEAAFEAAMKPVRAFAQGVAKAANDYHRSGRASAASCVADHLAAWARADALNRPDTHTGWFKLATTLSGLSLSYMQVRPALEARPEERKAIEAWLARRGGEVARYFEMLKTPRSSRNNHRAWAGLAAAAAGVASGDKGLLAKGMESYRIVVCQATEEGALPMELERGRKAAEYHLYALAALTTLAELGERNGHGALKECAGALGRVQAFTLAAARDPARVEALAGAPQEPRERFLTPAKLVFLEPMAARTPSAASAAGDLLAKRPLALTDLGGDQTLLYARPSARP